MPSKQYMFSQDVHLHYIFVYFSNDAHCSTKQTTAPLLINSEGYHIRTSHMSQQPTRHNRITYITLQRMHAITVKAKGNVSAAVSLAESIFAVVINKA